MRQFATLIFLLSLLCLPFSSGRASSYLRINSEISGQDTLTNITLKPVYVFQKGVDRRRFWRLVRAVERVYPLAKVAQQKISEMEETLAALPSKRDQKEYVRKIYKEIKEEYTPILMKMTMTDGRVLIRLIDRETDFTAYEVVSEFKGGLTASFWQGVGKLFGQNLKDEYGKSEEDKIIEKIIRYYEAGLL